MTDREYRSNQEPDTSASNSGNVRRRGASAGAAHRRTRSQQSQGYRTPSDDRVRHRPSEGYEDSEYGDSARRRQDTSSRRGYRDSAGQRRPADGQGQSSSSNVRVRRASADEYARRRSSSSAASRSSQNGQARSRSRDRNQTDRSSRGAYASRSREGSGDAYAREASRYEQHEQTPPYHAPRTKSATSGSTKIAIAVIAAIVIGIIFLFFPPIFNVTVNGQTYRAHIGSTVQDAINDGYASPVAGNLMAVDGSVITPGGGKPFVATINGGEGISDPNAKLGRNDEVQIQDGENVEEESTQTTESVPHGSNAAESTAGSYYYGSIHVYSDGEDGEQVTKTGSISGKTVTEVTKQPIDTGYHAFSADVGDEKVVAITFDDGPWEGTTDQILDILKENDAHATFFEIGSQIADFSDTVKRIHEEGNQIATHTWDHAAGSGNGVNLTYMTADEQIEEIQKGIEAIESTVGTEVSHILRAPGGNYYGSLVETLHPYVTAEIGWDVDTEDWRQPGASVIASRIQSVKPGQVVLMHDGGGDRSQTVEALRTAIPALKEQGYSFVTIDELMKYNLVEQNGDEGDDGQSDDGGNTQETAADSGEADAGETGEA